MIIERKDYQASHASQTVSYEVTDDYGHTASLTPEQTESLHQWLADNALQIHKDIHNTSKEGKE